MGIKDTFSNFFGKKEGALQESKYFDGIIDNILKEAYAGNVNNYWQTSNFGELESYKLLKSENAETKKQLLFYLIPLINKYAKKSRKSGSYSGEEDVRKRNYVLPELFNLLMRSNLDFSDIEIIRLFREYKNSDETAGQWFRNWPIGFTLRQVERIVKKRGLSASLKNQLTETLGWKLNENGHYYWGSDLEKVRVKIEKIIFESDNKDGKIAPYKLPNDRLAEIVNVDISKLKVDEKENWYSLFHLFIKVTGAKPSAKYLRTTGAIIGSMGSKKFKEIAHSWLEFVISLKEIETQHHQTYNGHEYMYSSYFFLHEKNLIFLKGLVWSLSKFHDSKTLNLLAKLTERAFKKIPGVGPTAAGVGNACIYTLGNTKGLEGISHLSRLKLQIKQNNTKKLIEKYLDESSTKLGISSSEIEEMSIPEFGLRKGSKSYQFDDYLLKLEINGLGKVLTTWIKPDGSSQKTPPTFTKSSPKHKELLKRSKNDVAQIKKYLTAQRDRIDRSYLFERIWTYKNFLKFYLDHGLVGFIAKDLIWEFKKEDEFISGLFYQEEWTDKNGKKLNCIAEDTLVRLWHPVYSNIEEVLVWRTRLEELKIKQTLKQAYREVYILTDAEVNTGTYSNRMAAHLLKQHQFNALTAIRGWRYSLLGAYDHGKEGEIAKITLKEYKLEAQFWIDEIHAADAFNDAGIWDYVSTDQIRFLDERGEVVELVNIPKIVFSEIMRDADLFVGVASVGNDPEWRDSGGLRQQYRDYWTNYSFGELNEIAKTRKDILEKLVPRLKISNVASIDGKFLKIKGKKRTYKIHIGSSNILMEPNDQYLCIVPARGKDKNLENVFLPFEGDRGLSLVLSKAFLLADDDKITDSTILSQIR